MGNKKRNCITLNQSQAETMAEGKKKKMNYLHSAICYTEYPSNGKFRIKYGKKSHSKLVMEIKYAVSPTASLL